MLILSKFLFNVISPFDFLFPLFVVHCFAYFSRFLSLSSREIYFYNLLFLFLLFPRIPRPLPRTFLLIRDCLLNFTLLDSYLNLKKMKSYFRHSKSVVFCKHGFERKREREKSDARGQIGGG